MNIFKRIKNQFFKTDDSSAEKSNSQNEKLPVIDPPFEIPLSIKGEYDTIIYPHIPYYRDLVDEEKELFLKRVYIFCSSKHFHFLDLEEQPVMPILISAVAVQITFGLD